MTEKQYQEESEKLLKGVPKKYHEGVKYLAWEYGHAYGYYEVYIHLQMIVSNIFNK